MREYQLKLIAAAESGDYTAVRSYLLMEGIDINFQEPENNKPAIHTAICNGYLNIVELLCAHDADLNLPTNTVTPIMAATWLGHVQIVKLLLASGKIMLDQVDKDGDSVLYMAIRKKWMSILEILIAAGADINQVNIVEDRTPLCLAIDDNNVVAFNLLLAHPNIQVNATSTDGKTALYHAVDKKNIYFVRQLLASPGIDVRLGMKVTNDAGITQLTPLMGALQLKGNPPIIPRCCLHQKT